MPTFHLTVDGREVSVHDTVRLFQPVPFPGGHRYELVVHGARGWPWDEVLPAEAPLTSHQREIFLALERLIAAEPSDGSPPAAFALNTISAIGVRHGAIHISGVCSAILLDEPHTG